MKEYFVLMVILQIIYISIQLIEGFDNEKDYQNNNIWLYWENKPGRTKSQII